MACSSARGAPDRAELSAPGLAAAWLEVPSWQAMRPGPGRHMLPKTDRGDGVEDPAHFCSLARRIPDRAELSAPALAAALLQRCSRCSTTCRC